MGVWNWWGLEMFVLFGGYVSTTALAAQSVLRAVAMLSYMIPVGLRMATQITIGKSIGNQNSKGIRKYYRTSLEMGLIYAVIMATILLTNSTRIFGIFTQNVEVMEALTSTLVTFIVFCIVDQIQGIAVSALVVSGRQFLGGIISWIGYGLIGVSLLVYNVFLRGGDLNSIWSSAFIAVAFNTIAFLVIGFTTDWETFAKEAAEKRAKQQQEIKQAETENDPEDNKFTKSIQ